LENILNILFLSIFIALGIGYLILGVLVSRGIKTKEDYFLAGRKLGLFPLTFTLIATQIGGGMMLGTAAQSYNIGYFGIFYTLGICLGFLFLGLGLAAKLRSYNVETTAQLFEVKYKSIFLRKVASVLSVLTLFGILGAQVIALRSVLLALGLENEIVFLCFWLFIIAYTVIGGLRAVAFTDTFQIIFLLIVFIILFISNLLGEPSSFFGIKSFLLRQKFFSREGLNFLILFPVIFNPMMFSFIEQDLAQRFFSAKTKKSAGISAIIASIALLIFSFVPVYFGMKAKLNNIVLFVGANPLVAIVSKLSSSLFLSLVVCALAAALTSTAASLLCAISSNICQDFDFSSFGVKNKLKFSKIVTFIVGILAVFVAYFSDDIISILIQSYELSISCLFVPIFLCYFKKSLTKTSAGLSIILGFLGFILFRIYPISFPKELAALFLSFGGYVIGDLMDKDKILN